jgi:PAS domain S-box-containing protein
MLNGLLDNPELERYITTCRAGQAIFSEGDESKDLYILVSGHLDFLKGDQTIGEVTEKGALFGEMSFLLGSKRTATARAKDDVKTIRIPGGEITDFLSRFPMVATEITKVIAKRLDERSQVLYGLKEFADQLPDALIITDKDGKILNWNVASERLYGRDWHQMQNKSLQDVYENPMEVHELLETVRSKHTDQERILEVRHPEKGKRYVSTSTTALHDGHWNFQGILSLGRDVTVAHKLERRYRQSLYWLIPALVLIALLIGAIFYGYPYFTKGHVAVDAEKAQLRNQLARDFLLLKSLLVAPFEADDRKKTTLLMKDFFEIQKPEKTPYTGLVLLTPEKRVFDVYSIMKNANINGMLGTSYSGVIFEGTEKSQHRVLTLYRSDKDHPMGQKGIEMAFKISKNDHLLGWLIFQMDIHFLSREYNMDGKALLEFYF